MTPEQTTETAARLKAACAADNDDAASEAAMELLIGMAMNLARLAHPTS